MKQFSALVRKEWQTHKNSFLVPLYSISGIMLLFGIISAYGYIRYGGARFSFQGFPDIEREYMEAIVWNVSVAISGVIGIFCLATINHVNESMLNHDHQKKCEILHSSQPCSAGKIVAAKWSFSFIGMMLQHTVISLFCALLLGGFFALMGQHFWLSSIYAALSILPMLLYATFVVNSIIWLFSCIFRRKSSVYSWIFIVGGHILHLIIKNTWPQLKIPSPLLFIFECIARVFKYKSSAGFSWFGNTQSIGSWNMVMQLAVASGLYLLGYYIYKNREIA